MGLAHMTHRRYRLTPSPEPAARPPVGTAPAPPTGRHGGARGGGSQSVSGSGRTGPGILGSEGHGSPHRPVRPRHPRRPGRRTGTARRRSTVGGGRREPGDTDLEPEVRPTGRHGLGTPVDHGGARRDDRRSGTAGRDAGPASSAARVAGRRHVLRAGHRPAPGRTRGAPHRSVRSRDRTDGQGGGPSHVGAAVSADVSGRDRPVRGTRPSEARIGWTARRWGRGGARAPRTGAARARYRSRRPLRPGTEEG